jgi:hypothetical protein
MDGMATLPSRRPPPLSVAEVLAWADAHRARVGTWPNACSGAIPDATLGTNWRQVDNALRYGLRGLPGKSSLAQLLAEHRGHRNAMALPRLTVAKILRWADTWQQCTGVWPLIESGPIPDATDGDTWQDIDTALRSRSPSGHCCCRGRSGPWPVHHHADADEPRVHFSVLYEPDDSGVHFLPRYERVTLPHALPSSKMVSVSLLMMHSAKRRWP